MQRLNVGFWYTLAKRLNEAARVNLLEAKSHDVLPYFFAGQALDELDKGAGVEITTSRGPCRELLEAVTQAQRLVLEKPSLTDEAAKKRWQNEVWQTDSQLRSSLDTLEKVLQEEMKIADVYAVGQKRIYSTRLLIEKADDGLGAEARSAISEPVRKDLREAGRCLAFELPTAAGYHAMRAAEKALRDWYHEVLDKKADRVSWAKAVEDLREAGADEATLAAFDRVRELHRNPLAHPEIFLALEEALDIFGAAETAINAAGREITKAQGPEANQTV